MVIDRLNAKMSLREAQRGFLLSLKASNRYSPKYILSMGESIGQLADHAEGHAWPEGISRLTTQHVEEYLVSLQGRARWFGRQGGGTPLSEGNIATQYGRLKVFFNWLVRRGYLESNPMNLIPRPRVQERVIATVSEQDIKGLLKLTDPRYARTAFERFIAIRNRAVLLLLVDTPARLTEVCTMARDAVDLEQGVVKVLGKGRRERWMPLGSIALEGLWHYLKARDEVAKTATSALWVSTEGWPLKSDWVYQMLKRLGKRAGMSNLHTHRFRHTYATNALRGGMPERVLRIIGGWKRIPDTYFRTLGMEDAVRFHRQISPADRLR